MTYRILCPVHEENTPSCVIYPDGKWFCFGCRATGFTKDLGIKDQRASEKYIEDIKHTLNVISKLPTKEIRGLEFPYDVEGYYVVYPKVKYYIKRLFNAAANFKYQSPSGHPKPIFDLTKADNTVLFVIEGQLNALSAAKACPELSIVSPGSATDFCKEVFLKYYLQFANVVICSDLDIPGVEFGRKLQKLLMEKDVHCVLYPMEEDFNQILQNQGVEGVKKEVKAAMALLRMPKIRINS